MTVTDPKVNQTDSASVAEIKRAFVELEAVLDQYCPAGRRKAVALTNLETAAMWAVKSVFEP